VATGSNRWRTSKNGIGQTLPTISSAAQASCSEAESHACTLHDVLVVKRDVVPTNEPRWPLWPPARVTLSPIDAVLGEQVGAMNPFQGAYAGLRNQTGHRDVDYDDVTEPVEAVASASLLLHIHRVERRLAR
jgi:hypothetical protein